jgi:hypothetical protein
MSDNLELDIDKIVLSLTNQIAQQAQKIAILEATVDALNKALQNKEEN